MYKVCVHTFTYAQMSELGGVNQPLIGILFCKELSRRHLFCKELSRRHLSLLSFPKNLTTSVDVRVRVVLVKIPYHRRGQGIRTRNKDKESRQQSTHTSTQVTGNLHTTYSYIRSTCTSTDRIFTSQHAYSAHL